MILASDGALDVETAHNQRSIPADLLARIAESAQEVVVQPRRGTVMTDDLNPLDVRQLPNNDLQRQGTLSGPFRDLFVPSR